MTATITPIHQVGPIAARVIRYLEQLPPADPRKR